MANQTLYALFQTVSDAERAIGALTDHGVPAANIGVVARRPAEEPETDRVKGVYNREADTGSILQNEPVVSYTQEAGTLPAATLASTATPTSTADTEDNVNTVGKEGITTTTPQDAAAGAAVGTGVGMVGGLLAAAAALVVPGVGLVMAGGALAAAIGAAVATTAAGAAVGGVAGYLRDMGMPEQAAQNAADRVHEGDYLISVTVDSTEYDDIERLLLKYNAAGVDDNVEKYVEAPVIDAVAAAALPTTLTTTTGPDGMVIVPMESRPATLTTIPESLATAPDAEPAFVTESLDGTPIVHTNDEAGAPRRIPVGQADRIADELDRHDEAEVPPHITARV